MAGEDYSIKTKVEADVSNFERGMNKVEKSLKDFSNKLADSINRLGKKGLIGSIANVTLAMQGLTKSFNTVIKVAQDVGKAVNECTEAYKGQVIAERALDTAIANNPFISGESSKALLQFASDMQKVTNYGDDELIPMMTKGNLGTLSKGKTPRLSVGIEVKKKKRERESPGSLIFQNHAPPPHPFLREETWVKACLPWGLGLTPNTRGCKHFSSHINRRDSLPDTLEFSCQELVAKQK